MPFVRIVLVAFASLFYLLNLASLVTADESMGIDYRVDLSDAKNHYVSVRIDVLATDETTILMMPVWTPGSYLVREYARNVDSVRAIANDGSPLRVDKVRKNRWRVQTRPGEPFSFSYRVYCNELSVRTNFVNSEYALLNGAATFMTIPERMDQPHTLVFDLPKHWTRIASPLSPVPRFSQSRRAANFDQLVDSPIVAGNVRVYPFEVNGIPHSLVNVGEQGTWDGDAAAADLASIVEAQHAIWKTIPYKAYMFINVIGPGGGGLEHDNSCTMISGHWSFRDAKRYERWLTLASHEFFHAWNVRRLRPKSLMRYDYENEVYTPSLWVAEGVTSYYEHLALARASLIDQREMLNRLSRDIQSVQTRPGRRVQSLKEASFDTWIKFYRPDENSNNTRISYYGKGAIVAWLLDARIRQASQGKRSLDDVMRIMFDRFRDTGYAPSDFRKVASEVAGQSLEPFFASAVDSIDELDYQPALAWWGLRLPGSATLGYDESDESENGSGSAWLGIRLSNNRVSQVTADSPATQVGINTDDELLAIDDFRFTGSLNDWLARYRPGDEIELLINRAGRLKRLRVRLAGKPKMEWKLFVDREASDEQKQHLSRWLSPPVKIESEDRESAEARTTSED